MANFSFDIVSEVNWQEVDNALNQAQKELAQRYDFKGSKSSISYDDKEKKITLIGDDDYKLRAVKDILVDRLTKRNVSPKFLVLEEPEPASGNTLRQVITISNGIPKEKAKEINTIIKDLKLKVQTQVEGEKIRVMSAKKDELQVVITHLKSIDYSIPLSFCNYR